MIGKQMLMLGCAAGALVAASLAQGQAFNGLPKTTAGAVVYFRATPGVETVQVESPTAIIAWSSVVPDFLPVGNTATFQNGPNNTDFVVLNRIQSGTPIRFDGHVISQITLLGGGGTNQGGTVLFSSPGGIIIGSTAVFDVGSLVLTSLNVVDDGAGNFYDAAAQGIQLNPTLGVPAAAVVTEAGAQINSPVEGNYIAMIAPQVTHGGSVRVNGSAAYVAGQRVQFRVNQGLFDIIVDAGTANPQPLVHTGSTTGPASTGDTRGIYMVAVPNSVAITALLSGNVGFDPPPLGAAVENGVVVLSAGFNVAGGAVDRFGDFTPPPVPGVDASFDVRGGNVTSDLLGFAATDMRAGNDVAATLAFSQDVSLFAGRRAHLFAGGAGVNVTVGGNAFVSTAETRAADGSVDHQGGDSAIFISKGGSIAIAGDAVVDASAQGQVSAVLNHAGTGTGGTASIFGDSGTIAIGGNVTLRATGAGGVIDFAPNDGGTGLGGTARIDGQAGATINIGGSLRADASGRGSRINGSMPIPGADGQGGEVSVGATGGGTVAITGPALLVNNGTGGEVLGGTNAAGEGDGGTVRLTATGTFTLGGPLTIIANGQGGMGPVGGDAFGGQLEIEASQGQFTFASIDFDANATGGDALPGGAGGFARGGGASIQARSIDPNPSRIAGGAVDISLSGAGGRGGNALVGVPAGQGGGAEGGSVDLNADSANGTVQLGAVNVVATGTGGAGGDSDQPLGGGRGGDALGGVAHIGAVPGPPAPTQTGSARFGGVTVEVSATGGRGGRGGGTGGNGRGGTVRLVAGGAPTQVIGATALTADANGGAGGAPGAGGGPVGNQGVAQGGNVLLQGFPNGTLTAGDVTGSAAAMGLPGTGNTPGDWHLVAAIGSAINLSNLTLAAAATGTPAVRPFSSLEPNGGTINVAQVAALSTPGEIRVLANGAGRITGGRFTLTAGDSLTFSHAAPTVSTIDATDLFGTAGADFSAGAGVVTRTANKTDIRAVGNANIAGRIEGQAILLRAAALDLAATGAIGASGSETVDTQVTGNAGLAGQVLGGDILVSAVSLNLAGSGAVGDGVTNRTDLRATGAMTLDGRVLGRTILVNAGSFLNQGAGGVIGNAAGTDLADIRTTANAAFAGQVLGRSILIRAASLDLAASGAIGTGTSATVDAQATGNANLAGQVLGGDILLSAASLNLAGAGAIGDAATSRADLRATGAMTADGRVLGRTILINAGSLTQAAAGVIGSTTGTDLADLRTTGNATLAGQVLGRAIVLRASGLTLAAGGAIGAGATATVDAQATGNAAVAGQVLGGDILLSAASVNLAGTGAVGDAATTRADLRAAGAMTADGRVLGRTILINAGTLSQGAAGVIGSATGTDLADVRATGDAAIAGQVLGRSVLIRAAGLGLAAGGAIGAGSSATIDVQATGTANVAGQVLGGDILLSAAALNLAGTGRVGDAATTRADLRATGNAALAGQVLGRTILVNAGTINLAAAGTVGGAATETAELRAAGNAAIAGRLLGRTLLVGSSDIDLSGALGDAGTQSATLLPNATGITAVIGGAVQDTGYTLTNAEAGRIRAGTLRILPPAAAGLSLLVRDLNFAAANVGRLEIDTPGAARVEGALAMTNAAAANGISFTARQRIEVLTPAGSIRVRDAAGAPGGTLLLASNNIWIVPQPVLALLNANPNYAGRDADLLSNEGVVEPRGYAEANAVELATGGTVFVQNSGASFTQGFGGVTVGPGGLVMRPTGAAPAMVSAFGRRLNADGSVTAGTPFFFQVDFQTGQASYTGPSNFNTCIIVTRVCGGGASGPQGPDPITGPVGGSDAILLPPLGDEDDLVDTSFSADPLIEEPVTSGGEATLWGCDDDRDGDCDDRN